MNFAGIDTFTYPALPRAHPFVPADLIAIVNELAGRVVERRTNTLLPALLPTDVRRERRREQRDVLLC